MSLKIIALKKVTLTVPETAETALRPISLEVGKTAELSAAECEAAKGELNKLHASGAIEEFKSGFAMSEEDIAAAKAEKEAQEKADAAEKEDSLAMKTDEKDATDLEEKANAAASGASGEAHVEEPAVSDKQVDHADLEEKAE